MAKQVLVVLFRDVVGVDHGVEQHIKVRRGPHGQQTQYREIVHQETVNRCENPCEIGDDRPDWDETLTSKTKHLRELLQGRDRGEDKPHDDSDERIFGDCVRRAWRTIPKLETLSERRPKRCDGWPQR
jgi:hypothetical protein